MTAGPLALALAATGLAAAPVDPRTVAVLPVGQVPAMLGQCSRAAPIPGTGYRRPDQATIAAMEGRVRVALPAARLAQSPALGAFPHGFVRQYVGYRRGGRRFLYGKYVPIAVVGSAADIAWKRQAIRIYDGGAAIFGAEYDVVGGTVSHLASNGNA